MMTRRGANAAPDLSTQHPASQIVRLRDRAPAPQPREAAPRDVVTDVDDDDLYGNMPFTD
jgi:hypothetical protein